MRRVVLVHVETEDCRKLTKQQEVAELYKYILNKQTTNPIYEPRLKYLSDYYLLSRPPSPRV